MALDLVERLARIQEAHGWTDEELAQRAGIARPMWAAVRIGKSRLGHRSLGAIVRHFPELRDEVLSYLVEDSGADTNPPEVAVA